jgi:hypothetical protein
MLYIQRRSDICIGRYKMIENDLLEFFTDVYREWKLEKLLISRGYSSTENDTFGLNQWTKRLLKQPTHNSEEQASDILKDPKHLTSFLAVPYGWKEELINTSTQEICDWIAEYNWYLIPEIERLFSHNNIRATSTGIFWPKWFHGLDDKSLERFLLICRDGTVEFGLGRETYSNFEEFTVFRLIQIIGRLWQFLILVRDFYHRFLLESQERVLIIVNIRGTDNVLIGHLAKGWNEPISRVPFEAYRPKCLEKNIQIRRDILISELQNDIDSILRWFATRIENGWGQLEPRCYVHPNIDDSKPFAQPKI